MQLKHVDEEEDREEDVRGCLVTADDRGAVAISIICCACYIVYGASVAALGTSLPTLAVHYDKSQSELSLAFTVRGLGFLLGALLSSCLLRLLPCLAKDVTACLALAVAGMMCAAVSAASSYSAALLWFLMQGTSFGVLSSMSNCILPELWGRRARPWMQAMYGSFGMGGMLGAALTASVGRSDAFHLMALASGAPLALLLLYRAARLAMSSEEAGVRAKQGMPAAAPWALRAAVGAFIFTCSCMEMGVAGMVSTFAMQSGVASDASSAAFLAAAFWTALTAGRLLAVLTASLTSAADLIRCHLIASVFSCFACDGHVVRGCVRRLRAHGPVLQLAVPGHADRPQGRGLRHVSDCPLLFYFLFCLTRLPGMAARRSCSWSWPHWAMRWPRCC